MSNFVLVLPIEFHFIFVKFSVALQHEWTSIRNLEPGEYIVNIHLYGPYGDDLPVPVTVKITGKGDLGEIFSGEVSTSCSNVVSC